MCVNVLSVAAVCDCMQCVFVSKYWAKVKKLHLKIAPKRPVQSISKCVCADAWRGERERERERMGRKIPDLNRLLDPVILIFN